MHRRQLLQLPAPGAPSASPGVTRDALARAADDAVLLRGMPRSAGVAA